MFLAEVTTIGLAVLGLAFTIGGSILLGKQKFGSPVRDKEGSTFATRGSYIPLIIGRARVGAVICWVGNRRSKKVGGGGKGLFGGSGGSTKRYFESAMHAICVGPAVALREIYVNGSPVLTREVPGGITSVSHPSGTLIAIEDVGFMRIYWGEPAQAVNTDLASSDQMGYASRWPRICYVHWDQYKLGSTPQWPNIEYEITGPSVVSRVSIPVSPIVGNGYNPAHILAQLIWEKWPYGCGEDPSLADEDNLTALASAMLGEGLAFRSVMIDGSEAKRAVVDVLSDAGIFWNFENGKHRFYPVRERVDQLILREEHLREPLPDFERRLTGPPIDVLGFTFADQALRHTPNAFSLDDDGRSILEENRRSESIDIPSVDELSVATTVAVRREQEQRSGESAITVRANRSMRYVRPGEVMFVEPYSDSLRILGVKPLADSGAVDVRAVPDYYGVVHPAITPGAGAVVPAVPLGPAEDAATHIIEPPNTHPGYPYVNSAGAPGGAVPILVPRIRAHENIEGAEIHISTDGVTFRYLGSTTTDQTGGTLAGDMTSSTPGTIETGADINILGPENDIAELALDLSSDPTARANGVQLLIIEDEVMLLERVQAVSPGVWRLISYTRGSYGTTAPLHAEGTPAFIVNVTTIPLWVDPIFQRGATIYVKTVPFGSLGGMNIADVTHTGSYTIPA